MCFYSKSCFHYGSLLETKLKWAFRQKAVDMKSLGLFMDFTWEAHFPNRFHSSTFLSFLFPSAYSLFIPIWITAQWWAFYMHNEIQLFVTSSKLFILSSICNIFVHKGATTTVSIYVLNIHHCRWTVYAIRLSD